MNIEVKISIKPIDYMKSMKILEQRVIDVFQGNKDEFLWLLEHRPVYTAGSSSKSSDLLNKKLKVIKTNRGGKHTFHGPGQKIVYFVLNLNKREKNIKKLINNVENCIIDSLQEYNLISYSDKKNIGIWINHKRKREKIASIGLRVKKWIAYHGFALNIRNDLSKYDGIVPCGIKNKGITNLKNLGINNFDNIDDIIVKKFLNIFL